MVAAYVSYDKKDPLAGLSHPEVHNNPKIVEIRGTLYDPKTAKLDFEKPWIYITLLSQVDLKVRIVARFRQPRKQHVKTSAAAAAGIDGDDKDKDNSFS